MKLDLVEARVMVREPCHVCGGVTEKWRHYRCESADGGLRACERCVEAGNIDERLAAHASNLEATAKELRSLIGRVEIVPTFTAWQAAEEAADKEECAAQAERDSRPETWTPPAQVAGDIPF
jgi:hypothetical protein